MHTEGLISTINYQLFLIPLLPEHKVNAIKLNQAPHARYVREESGADTFIWFLLLACLPPCSRQRHFYKVWT